MRRASSLLMLVPIVALLATGASAQETPGHYAGQSSFRLSLGSFAPAGDSTYWREKERDFLGSTSGFDDLTLSLEYTYFVSPRFGLLVSFGGWEGKQTQSYRDFVDLDGSEIAHLTTVQEAWLDFGVIFHFLSRRAAVMPYIGAGGSFILWELSEEGHFLDFRQAEPSIFSDAFFSDGDAIGFMLLAGVEIPIADQVTLFVEGRWRSADDELGSDFAGFGSLDLSGRSLSGGVSITF